MQTQAYVYKWTELSTGKWYIGSRTAKRCHPDDGYICSSKIVKPLILQNPDNWRREIICIGHAEDMRELEAKYLTILNAADDFMSYNQTNGNGKFSMTGKPSPMKGKTHTEEAKQKMSERLKGRPTWNKGQTASEETKQKISESKKGKPSWNKGKPTSEETKQKLSKPRSDETKQKMSESKKGKPSSFKGKSHTEETKQKLSKPQLDITCPHCNKSGGQSAMKRYHFDNCKHKAKQKSKN